MDVQSNSDQHPATDDQELAKVLAGVDEQASQLPSSDDTGNNSLQFSEPSAAPAGNDDPSVAGTTTDATVPADEAAAAAVEVRDEVVDSPSSSSTISPALESIKKDALEELRPLVTKLDLPADEKFDTMLLIIRSTDDQSLLNEAYTAAKAITDEKKRAEALLDIIKEIDYFGNHAAA